MCKATTTVKVFQLTKKMNFFGYKYYRFLKFCFFMIWLTSYKPAQCILQSYFLVHFSWIFRLYEIQLYPRFSRLLMHCLQKNSSFVLSIVTIFTCEEQYLHLWIGFIANFTVVLTNIIIICGLPAKSVSLVNFNQSLQYRVINIRGIFWHIAKQSRYEITLYNFF